MSLKLCMPVKLSFTELRCLTQRDSIPSVLLIKEKSFNGITLSTSGSLRSKNPQRIIPYSCCCCFCIGQHNATFDFAGVNESDYSHPPLPSAKQQQLIQYNTSYVANQQLFIKCTIRSLVSPQPGTLPCTHHHITTHTHTQIPHSTSYPTNTHSPYTPWIPY